MYEILFNIIAPVFICAGLGFYWAKSGRAFHMETVTGLVTNIGAPLLTFSTLVQLESSLLDFIEFGMIALIALLSFQVIGFVILKLAKLDIRSFLPAIIFPNSGNMGVPLCLFAFGQEGLTLALAFFTINSILQFTMGVWLASGTSSIIQVLKTPLLFSVALALVIKASGFMLPEWLLKTTDLLGAITIPLMLMALGVSLASLSIKHLNIATVLSVLRLMVGFGVGVGIAELFGLTGVERGVLILECTMPVAVFNYLFSLKYNRAPGQIAGCVLISTIISFATMPLLLLFVLP